MTIGLVKWFNWFMCNLLLISHLYYHIIYDLPFHSRYEITTTTMSTSATMVALRAFSLR